ncbi:unnamed protein product [Brugia pahangi]|uniref:Transposase n=1 Tax=Brugia pahangi TaxID=6280 RepID=A0A0N4T0N5_BRUPA|nr:unnamed protein product [Brugia pahangi]
MEQLQVKSFKTKNNIEILEVLLMKTINYASTINNYFDNKLIHLQKLDRIREPINSSKARKRKGIIPPALQIFDNFSQTDN